jgi:hypothetical protein
LNEQQVDAIASRMAAQQITIASTVPIGTLHMPLQQLRDKGVFVMTGTDSVIDHWSPYGLGDMLEKANLYAQLYIRPNEQTLSRSLAIATGNVLPLNDKGQRVWPKEQDEASFVLVDASCSAEAVARISPRTATFHKGKMVWGRSAEHDRIKAPVNRCFRRRRCCGLEARRSQAGRRSRHPANKCKTPPAGVSHRGYFCGRIAGNKITSRMVWLLVNSITIRSIRCPDRRSAADHIPAR